MYSLYPLMVCWKSDIRKKHFLAFSCFAVIYVCSEWEKISAMKPASSVSSSTGRLGKKHEENAYFSTVELL